MSDITAPPAPPRTASLLPPPPPTTTTTSNPSSTTTTQRNQTSKKKNKARLGSFWLFSCFHADEATTTTTAGAAAADVVVGTTTTQQTPSLQLPTTTSRKVQDLLQLQQNERHGDDDQDDVAKDCVPLLLKSQQQQAEEPTTNEEMSSSSFTNEDDDDEDDDERCEDDIKTTTANENKNDDVVVSVVDTHCRRYDDDHMGPHVVVLKQEELIPNVAPSSSTSTATSSCSELRKELQPKEQLPPPTPSSSSPLPLRLELPLDIMVYEICRFIPDPTTLCRVACVSKDLYQRILLPKSSSSSSLPRLPLITTTTTTTLPRIQQATLPHQEISSSSTTTSSVMTVAPSDCIWNSLYHHRWTRSKCIRIVDLLPRIQPEDDDDDDSDDDDDHDPTTTRATLFSTLPTDTTTTTNNNMNVLFLLDWKDHFRTRFVWEGHVIQTIYRVVVDELEPDAYDYASLQQRSHGRIASTYIESEDWKQLIMYSQQLTDDIDDDDDDDDSNSNANDRDIFENEFDHQRRRHDNHRHNHHRYMSKKNSDMLDVLCAMANMELEYHPMLQALQQCDKPQQETTTPTSNNNQDNHTTTFQLQQRWSLVRFVAASAAFTLHCQQVVHVMNQLLERSMQESLWNPSFVTTSNTQVLYEQTAILLSHALRTVPNVFQRSSSLQELQHAVSNRLDEMAQAILQQYYTNKDDDGDDRMDSHQLGDNETKKQPRPNSRTLLRIMHHVLFYQYGIRHYCYSSQQHEPQQQQGHQQQRAAMRPRPNMVDDNDHYHGASSTGHDDDDDEAAATIANHDDLAVYACSISHVLDCHYPPQNNKASSYSSSATIFSSQCESNHRIPMTSHYHHHHPLHGNDLGCHPILVAIIYQAVAKRLGMIGDILYCPRNSHSILRFTSTNTSNAITSSSTGSNNNHQQQQHIPRPSVMYMDLVAYPGRLMTMAQCKELVLHCDLMTEQAYQDRRRNHILDDDDDDDDNHDMMAEEFCVQPPLTVASVVFWLVSPFLVKTRHEDDVSDSHDDDNMPGEDQPYDFLLGQLMEDGNGGGGGGGSLLSFLQDRLVFFSAIMRYSKLIS